MRNPGALVSLARLKSADDYTYLHSVAVCALMIALARQLGLSEADTREAGMAGLLHDIGKAVMPMDVLNKPGKLTDDEFRIIKRHPVEGHRLLVEGGSVSDIVRDVCLHHHEKSMAAVTPMASRATPSACLRAWGPCATYMTPSPPTAPTSAAGTRPNPSAR